MNRAIGWSFLVAVIGCVDAVDEQPAPSTTITTVAPPGEELQGRRLLGAYADTLATTMHVRAHTAATNRPIELEVSGAELIAHDSTGAVVYRGADPAFVGLVLSVVGGGELEIASVARLLPGVVVYGLVHRTSPSASGDPYCTIGRGAVPMAGRWTLAGLHELEPHILSFGCADAAAHKCTRWGYPAGGGGPGTGRWDHHQACTRMARADYCADGTPHTYDLTPIAIRDDLPGAQPATPALTQVTPWPIPPDELIFEGAWRGGSDVPVCLSRARWASRPVGGDCGLVLPDPRVQNGVRFCDDFTISDLYAAGALVLNASKTNEVRLLRWHHPGTGDRVATTTGYYRTTGPSYPPFGGYVYDGDDALLLRNLPGSVDPSTVTAVHQLALGTDRVVGIPSLLPGYAVGPLEGYTYNASATAPDLPPRTTLALVASSTDRTSTALATPTGYAFAGSLGFVIAP